MRCFVWATIVSVAMWRGATFFFFFFVSFTRLPLSCHSHAAIPTPTLSFPTYRFLSKLFASHRDGYPTTIEEDEALLAKDAARKPSAPRKFTTRMRYAVEYRLEEKRTLQVGVHVSNTSVGDWLPPFPVVVVVVSSLMFSLPFPVPCQRRRRS